MPGISLHPLFLGWRSKLIACGRREKALDRGNCAHLVMQIILCSCVSFYLVYVVVMFSPSQPKEVGGVGWTC